MKWKLLAIVVLLTGGGLAAAASLGVIGAKAAVSSTYLTAQAATADVIDQVAATGTIAATSTYGLTSGSRPPSPPRASMVAAPFPVARAAAASAAAPPSRAPSPR